MVDSKHPVRVAVQIHPQHADYEAISGAVRRAEELGADAVYNWDHFYPLYGDANGKHFEAWTMLGAWAEQTENIEIGCLVTCNSYRNANLLADMARTVDHIAGGRLVLGIGSGWFSRDYEEYGYEFGTAGSRLDDLADSLVTIEQRWAKLNPPPTRDIPVMIGGTGKRKTLRLVANHADRWHALFPETPDELAEPVETLLGWCERADRDPADIEWSYGLEPGDALRVLEQDAESYLKMGFTGVTFGTNGPDYSFEGLSEWLEWRDEINAR